MLRWAPAAEGRLDLWLHRLLVTPSYGSAQRIASADPLVESFVVHAGNESFSNVNTWGEVRTYLYKTGAEPDAFIGGRLAWREYISRAKRNRE
jgi:hypothetical protein